MRYRCHPKKPGPLWLRVSVRTNLNDPSHAGHWRSFAVLRPGDGGRSLSDLFPHRATEARRDAAVRCQPPSLSDTPPPAAVAGCCRTAQAKNEAGPGAQEPGPAFLVRTTACSPSSVHPARMNHSHIGAFDGDRLQSRQRRIRRGPFSWQPSSFWRLSSS